MAFTVEPVREFYLLDTKLENIFIDEFMTNAAGDHVKVYLLGLMYANSGTEADNAGIAKQLALEEEDVLKAWNYWEGLGIIKKNYKDIKDKFRYDVEFLCIKEQLYGKRTNRKSAAESLLPKIINNKELEELYKSIEKITGRLLEGKEPTEIIAWMDDYGASPEVIKYAYSYCVKYRKKDKYNYIGAVIKGWMEKQLTDTEKIENHLSEVDEMHFLYKRVIKALGFTRNATEKEKQIMDSWFDDMGFSIATVLEACGKTSGISNPNINYVNKVLANWHAGSKSGKGAGEKAGVKAVSVSDVYRYYDVIKKRAEDEAGERRNQIYLQIPKIKKIDEELRKCVMETSKSLFSGNSSREGGAAKYQSLVGKLMGQKAELLIESGYEKDYLETRYRCAACRDTGINDNDERCDCFKEVQYEAELWKNSLMK